MPPNFQPTLSSAAIREVDAHLHAPYTMQGAMGVERQLPKNITLAVTYTHSRGVDVLRHARGIGKEPKQVVAPVHRLDGA